MRRAALSLLLVLALPAAASAQADDAERHFEEGVAHLQALRHADAVGAFQRSLRAREAAGTLYNLGLALRGLNRCREAAAALSRQAEVDTNPERRAAGEGLLTEVRACVGELTITVRGRPDEVLLDGEVLSLGEGVHALPVDPGTHSVRARREGYRPAAATADVARGARSAVTVDLTAPLPGSIVVDADAAVTSIRVDGVALAPGSTRAEAAAGRHVVEVWFGAGSVAQRREVEVAPGGRAVVTVSRPPDLTRPATSTPVYTRWWFWTAVAGGVALATVGSLAAAGVFDAQEAPHAGPDGWGQVPFGIRFP